MAAVRSQRPLKAVPSEAAGPTLEMDAAAHDAPATAA